MVSGTLHYGQCSQMDEQKISAGSGDGMVLQKGKSACSLLSEQLKTEFFLHPRNTSPSRMLLLFIMELISRTKIGICETPVMICYTGYTNLTGMYE